MNISAIIPARSGSIRLPNKPLADIGGEPMIVHTWRAAHRHPDIHRVCVATDSQEIARAITDAGGEAVLTDPSHTTGTDRCQEVWHSWGDGGAVINLQGDEPFPDPHHLSAVCAALQEEQWDIVTAMRSASPGEPESPHRVKVAVNGQLKALYFSRAPVPSGGPFHIHIGVYGFAPGALKRCSALPQSALEQSERLEQLRWLEHGMSIGMVSVEDGTSPGPVDTAEDLDRLRLWFQQHTP
ncbi:3-deoxy-manno-octulosonate cytidylyltransferase [Flavobacteriales bacterium]|nr:3-deoxy-manno-octulosonate cytidylyltransferase [Flavobacteriales bacterium]